MKTIKYIPLLILLTIAVPLYPQINPATDIEIREFETEELILNNSVFQTAIDSFLLKTPCPILQDTAYKYFTVYFFTAYNFYIELEKESVSEWSSGFFQHRGYLFFVSGNYPTNTLKKTNRKRKFSYLLEKQPKLEDVPFWKIGTGKDSRRNDKIVLIDYKCW